MPRALSGRRRLGSLLALVALALAGCGGSGGSGGTLRITYTEPPDALDPAVAVTLEAWGAMQNTYIPLLTFAHADGSAGTKLVPGLAEALPQVSADGRTYRLRLRPGLHYSDGTPVRASDFRFAVERLLRLNSSGSPFYTDIAGAARFQRTGKGTIGGIRANDRSRRIVIRLRAPRGTFADELALPYAALLPPDTPLSNQTADPPPATGPYVISQSNPGHGWGYERNPAWESGNAAAMPDLPGGHFEAIRAKVVPNGSTQVNDVERGSVDWMRGPPPPDRLPEIRRRYLGTQFREEPTISVFYFWMNTRQAPFDDVRVRRAVNYAIDPEALERIYAGEMHATQQILPPGMPGYRRFHLYPHDMAKARALVTAADPRQRAVTIWTDSFEPNEEAGEYYQGVLRDLGLQPKLKVVPASDYFTVIGNLHTPDLDTGWGNWLLDYPHPNDYFQGQLSGEAIAPVGNTNWARFDEPAVDAEISRLGRERPSPRVFRAYSALDRRVMRQAPWAPFGNLTLSTFVSSSIDLDSVIFSPIFGQDLTSFRPS